MKYRRYLCCLVLPLILLGGCKTTGTTYSGTSDASGMAIDDSEYQPKADLSTRERLRTAIELLEVGRKVAAQAELEVYLNQSPDSQLAADLLRQINADPTDYFGTDYFVYTLQTGDSLSIVARRFLGDALKFYMLARFNGIDNPGRIGVGQEIKVPGSQPSLVLDTAPPSPAQAEPSVEPMVEPVVEIAAEAPVEPEPPAPPAAVSEAEPEESSPGFMSAAAATLPASSQDNDAIYARATELAQLGDYDQAIAQLEGGLRESPGDENMNGLLVSVYADYADELKTGGRSLEARRVLEQAIALRPGDAELARQMRDIDDSLAVERQYRIAVEYIDANAPDQAYDAFSSVLRKDPGHEQARSQQAKLLPAVTKLYHRRAVVAFRRQELDEALHLWGKILQIDPSHTNAQIYQAQALELKERLESLDSTD